MIQVPTAFPAMFRCPVACRHFLETSRKLTRQAAQSVLLPFYYSGDYVVGSKPTKRASDFRDIFAELSRAHVLHETVLAD